MARHSTAYYLTPGAQARERTAKRKVSGTLVGQYEGDPAVAYRGARRADDRRATANNEGRSASFGAGWASATHS